MTAILLFLRGVSPQIWVVAALLVALGIQTERLSSAHKDLAEQKAAYSQLQASYASAAASATQNYRAIEQARQSDKQEIQNEADSKIRDQLVDRSAYDDVSRRLRDARTALASRSCSAARDPGAGTPGPAASAAGDLQAQLQGRLDEAESRVADFADASSIAGTACERSYDSLTARIK